MVPWSMSLGASCTGSPSPWGGDRQTSSEKEQVSWYRTQYLLTVAVGRSYKQTWDPLSVSVSERCVFLLLRIVPVHTHTLTHTHTRLHLYVCVRVIRMFNPPPRQIVLTTLGRQAPTAKLDRDRLTPRMLHAGRSHTHRKTHVPDGAAWPSGVRVCARNHVFQSHLSLIHI